MVPPSMKCWSRGKTHIKEQSVPGFWILLPWLYSPRPERDKELAHYVWG